MATALDDLMEEVFRSLTKFIYDTDWINEICVQIQVDIETNGDLDEYLKKDYIEDGKD